MPRLPLLLALSVSLSLPLAFGCNDGGGGGGTVGPPDAGVAGPPRDVQRVDLLGLRPVGACSDSDLEARLLFNLIGDDGVPLAPGANINGVALALGDSFASSGISVESPVLYPSPDQLCASDADCEALGAGFTCRTLDPGADEPFDVCGRDVTFDIFQDSLLYRPTDAPPAQKAVVIALANGSSIAGDHPELGERSDAYSSDPDDLRVRGTIAFLSGLADLPGAAESEACVTWFTGVGSTSIRYAVAGGNDSAALSQDTAGDCMRSVPDVAAAATQDLLDITLTEEGIDGERSLWAAMRVAVEFVRDNSSANVDRHIVIFTDGPDEASNAAARQTPEFVAEIAALAGVRVHAIHLDNPNDGTPPSGPLDALAQVACETDGSYLFAESPEGVERALRSLDQSLGQRYELRIRVPELADVTVGGWRLGARLTMEIAGQTRTLVLTGDASGLLGEPIDTRLTFIRR